MSSERILWYFADPMCSWCWGFTPVIGAIREGYSDRLKIALMLGGLRPGTTQPVTPKFREEILGHWRDVQRLTGQPFAFEGALPEGFVYDTEPASRAVIAVAGIDPAAIFPYFKSVQAAFYAEGRDVTRAATLAELAAQHNIDESRFLERFESGEMRDMTRTHFRVTREAGVRGFPTIVLQAGPQAADQRMPPAGGAASGTRRLAGGYGVSVNPVSNPSDGTGMPVNLPPGAALFL